MPAPAKINPDLIRTIFRYEPETGQLVPTDLTARAARRTDKYQWEVGAHRYALHRLVWAYHNPDHPNPYAVQFKDGDATNTRIENLNAIHTNPRWVNHEKRVQVRVANTGAIHTLPANRRQVPMKLNAKTGALEVMASTIAQLQDNLNILRKQIDALRAVESVIEHEPSEAVDPETVRRKERLTAEIATHAAEHNAVVGLVKQAAQREAPPATQPTTQQPDAPEPAWVQRIKQRKQQQEQEQQERAKSFGWFDDDAALSVTLATPEPQAKPPADPQAILDIIDNWDE